MMEFKDKQKALNYLIETIHTYQPNADCIDVKKAFELADKAHGSVFSDCPLLP